MFSIRCLSSRRLYFKELTQRFQGASALPTTINWGLMVVDLTVTEVLEPKKVHSFIKYER